MWKQELKPTHYMWKQELKPTLNPEILATQALEALITQDGALIVVRKGGHWSSKSKPTLNNN